MLGGTGAAATISHVHVTSWSHTRGGPRHRPRRGQAVDPLPARRPADRRRLALLLPRRPHVPDARRDLAVGRRRLGDGERVRAQRHRRGRQRGRGTTLHDDQFASNTDDGLDVLGTTHGLSLERLVATGNGGNGLSISHGVKGARLTGVTANGNGEDGVALQSGITAVTADQVHADHNLGNGVTVDQASGTTLSGVTAGHDRIGVRVSGGSTDVAIGHVSLSANSQGGLLVDETTGLAVDDLSVRGPGASGLALSASGATVRTSTVSGVPRRRPRIDQSTALRGATITNVQRRGHRCTGCCQPHGTRVLGGPRPAGSASTSATTRPPRSSTLTIHRAGPPPRRPLAGGHG